MMTRTSAVGCSRKYGWITSFHIQAPASLSTAGSNAERELGWMFTHVGPTRLIYVIGIQDFGQTLLARFTRLRPSSAHTPLWTALLVRSAWLQTRQFCWLG